MEDIRQKTLARIEEMQQADLQRKTLQRINEIQGKTGYSATGAIGGGITGSLISGVGGVVDLSNFLLGLVGLPKEKMGYFGSENLTELARKAKMVKGEGAPETGPERIGETIGTAVTAFAPLGAVGRFGKAASAVTKPATTVAGKAKEVASGVFKPAVESFRQTPGQFAAAEAVSAVGAGVGGEVGRQIAGEDSLLGEIIGEVIGGGGAVAAAQYAKHMPTLRLIRELSAPFLKGQSERIAAQAVQKAVTEPKSIPSRAAQFQAIPGARLSMGAKAGSERLLNLERAIIDSVPELKDDVLHNEAITNKIIKESLLRHEGEEPMEQAIHFFEAHTSRVKRALHMRLMGATKKANDRIVKLGVDANREDISVIISDELEKALKDARAQERIIWESLPDIDMGMNNTRDAFETYISDEKVLPQFIRRFYQRIGGGLDDAEDVIRSFKDVKEFRTELLKYQTTARAAGDANSAHAAQMINEGILQDMAESGLGSDFDAVRAFSKELNDRFTRGRIGQVLRFSSRGGRAISEEMVSESLLPANAPKAAEGVRAARLAAEAMPGMPERQVTALEDGLQQIIRKKVFSPDGTFDLRKAQSFLKNNDELLRQFPELHKEIAGAITDEAGARILKERLANASSNLVDKRRSAVALIMGVPPEKGIRTLLNKPNRGKLLAQAVRVARKDETGAALNGLQDAYTKDLLEHGLRNAFDINGEQFISGTRMKKRLLQEVKLLKDSNLFTNVHIRRINMIIDNAIALEKRGMASAAAKEAVETSQDMLSDFLLSVIGANLGAKFAGGNLGAPLVAAGRGASMVRGLASKLPQDKIKHILADAIRDEKKMALLLSKDVSLPFEGKKMVRMNAWLADLGLDITEIFEEQ